MNKITLYRKTDLQLKPSVSGAKMWAVGLEKTMLTYFELEPNTIFPDHSHEAEQITLVLDGELTFTYGGKTTALKAGDVIAIPSNIRHSAFTGNSPCKAVDAWSPVRKEFFIRKAIGWGLREMAKANPDEAFDFLMKVKNKASGLTLREGSKRLPEKMKKMIIGK